MCDVLEIIRMEILYSFIFFSGKTDVLETIDNANINPINNISPSEGFMSFKLDSQSS